VLVAWFPGDRGLVANTADHLKAAAESVEEPFTPVIQLMLRLAGQAAEQSGDDLPSLADLVSQARHARAGDPYDLTMIAIVAMVTGRISDAQDLYGALVTDARAGGKVGWLPTLLAGQAQGPLAADRDFRARARAPE